MPIRKTYQYGNFTPVSNRRGKPQLLKKISAAIEDDLTNASIGFNFSTPIETLRNSPYFQTDDADRRGLDRRNNKSRKAVLRQLLSW